MSRTSLPALCLLSLLLGCTPPEQHIQRVIDQTLATCRGAEGDFADIELFQGEKRPLLKQACEMPVEGLKVKDKVTATATVGPYLWKVSTHPESGIWVVSDIIWQDIDDARRILEMEKPDPNSLAHAEKKFAKLQESMPKNAWIHRERLTNALRLRKATRAIDHKEHGTPPDWPWPRRPGRLRHRPHLCRLPKPSPTRRPSQACRHRLPPGLRALPGQHPGGLRRTGRMGSGRHRPGRQRAQER